MHFSKLQCQQCARLTQRKITTKEEKLKLAQHSSHTHSYIDKTGRRTSRHLTWMVFLSSQTLLAWMSLIWLKELWLHQITQEYADQSNNYDNDKGEASSSPLADLPPNRILPHKQKQMTTLNHSFSIEKEGQ